MRKLLIPAALVGALLVSTNVAASDHVHRFIYKGGTQCWCLYELAMASLFGTEADHYHAGGDE